MQWFKHGLSTRVQLMTFMITFLETKPQNTKAAVATELIGICPNQPCNPSVICTIKWGFRFSTPDQTNFQFTTNAYT